MRVLLHPGDNYGCGSHRLIFPGQLLAEAGHDVIVETQRERRLSMQLLPHIRTEAQQITEREAIQSVILPEGVDAIVMQRPSHKLLAEAVHHIRAQGVAVIVDVDDDLARIHPKNLAYLPLQPDRHHIEQRALAEEAALREANRSGLISELAWAMELKEPRRARQAKLKLDQLRSRARAEFSVRANELVATKPYPHSYANVQRACDDASMVVTSTPALLKRYARHGRGRVIYNYLADHYYTTTHVDSTDIAWPAVLFSHPDDPAVLDNALARVLADTDATFSVFGADDPDVPAAFGLNQPVPTRGLIDLMDWANAISQIGIGICPLADSVFNAGKSWLKPLELSAVGVPWIASPRAEYQRLHKMGAGLLADKPRDWHRHLLRLVQSADLRAELSEQGRLTAEQLRLRDHVQKHLDLWEAAVRVDRELDPVA